LYKHFKFHRWSLHWQRCLHWQRVWRCVPAQLPESLAELEGEALAKLPRWRLLVGEVVEVVVAG